jgi:hypothetical protein
MFGSSRLPLLMLRDCDLTMWAHGRSILQWSLTHSVQQVVSSRFNATLSDHPSVTAPAGAVA